MLDNVTGVGSGLEMIELRPTMTLLRPLCWVEVEDEVIEAGGCETLVLEVDKEAGDRVGSDFMVFVCCEAV